MMKVRIILMIMKVIMSTMKIKVMMMIMMTKVVITTIKMGPSVAF